MSSKRLNAFAAEPFSPPTHRHIQPFHHLAEHVDALKISAIVVRSPSASRPRQIIGTARRLPPLEARTPPATRSLGDDDHSTGDALVPEYLNKEGVIRIAEAHLEFE